MAVNNPQAISFPPGSVPSNAQLCAMTPAQVTQAGVSKAAHIRALASQNPTWSKSQLAQAAGVSYAQVHSAMKSAGTPGAPVSAPAAPPPPPVPVWPNAGSGVWGRPGPGATARHWAATNGVTSATAISAATGINVATVRAAMKGWTAPTPQMVSPGTPLAPGAPGVGLPTPPAPPQPVTPVVPLNPTTVPWTSYTSVPGKIRQYSIQNPAANHAAIATATGLPLARVQQALTGFNAQRWMAQVQTHMSTGLSTHRPGPPPVAQAAPTPAAPPPPTVATGAVNVKPPKPKPEDYEHLVGNISEIKKALKDAETEVATVEKQLKQLRKEREIALEAQRKLWDDYLEKFENIDKNGVRFAGAANGQYKQDYTTWIRRSGTVYDPDVHKPYPASQIWNPTLKAYDKFPAHPDWMDVPSWYYSKTGYGFKAEKARKAALTKNWDDLVNTRSPASSLLPEVLVFAKSWNQAKVDFETAQTKYASAKQDYDSALRAVMPKPPDSGENTHRFVSDPWKSDTLKKYLSNPAKYRVSTMGGPGTSAGDGDTFMRDIGLELGLEALPHKLTRAEMDRRVKTGGELDFYRGQSDRGHYGQMDGELLVGLGVHGNGWYNFETSIDGSAGKSIRNAEQYAAPKDQPRQNKRGVIGRWALKQDAKTISQHDLRSQVQTFLKKARSTYSADDYRKVENLMSDQGRAALMLGYDAYNIGFAWVVTNRTAMRVQDTEVKRP